MNITKRILKGVIKISTFVLKIVFFPITYTYRKLKQRSKKQKQNKNDFPGVYIVSNNDYTIKIGRSKHVKRRLRSYRGYQHDGKDIPILMLIQSSQHKLLEKQMHQFASKCGLERQGRTEVFNCSNKRSFLLKVRNEFSQDYKILNKQSI